MSAIDPTVPVDTEQKSQGASRMRDHRKWLYDFATAFLASHQGSGYDPSTWTGEFKIPFAAPGSPTVGDLYFLSTGQLHVYNAGPTDKLAGDLAQGTRCLFRQNTAPTGWTRDASLTTGAGLRYRTVASPTSGGTQDVGGALTHNPSTAVASAVPGGPSGTFVTGVPNHSALKYVDVVIASRD